MHLSIPFSPEVEQTLQRRAAAAGQDVATFVKEVVMERLAEDVPQPARATSHPEFMARLRQVIDLHPVGNGSVDDSRESIYADHGE